MPRRPSNVNQADVQRMIRAFKREGVAFMATLQPNGTAVFEPAATQAKKEETDNEWDTVR